MSEGKKYMRYQKEGIPDAQRAKTQVNNAAFLHKHTGGYFNEDPILAVEIRGKKNNESLK